MRLKYRGCAPPRQDELDYHDDGSVCSCFSSSLDSGNDDDAMAGVEDLRLLREKWSMAFAPFEDEDDESEVLERDDPLARDEQSTNRMREIMLEQKDTKTKSEENGAMETASGETGTCDEQRQLLSDELSALGAIVRKEREERVKREVLNTLRKNEREMEFAEVKARSNAQRVIAKYSRKWFHRRVIASLEVQRYARGFLTRVQLKRTITMIVRVQRRWKLLLLIRLRTNASVCIQNAFRTYLRRKNFEKERKENAAATLIQTHVKRFIATREYTILRRKVSVVQACAVRWICKRKRAVELIQKIFRSHAERKRLGKYAIRIQAAFRGYRVRHRFAAILDSNGTETHEDLLPTLSDDSFDDFDVIEEEYTASNTASLLDDAFYFARPSPPLPRAVEDVKDTPSTSFDEDLHADLLAMRAKNLADERKRRDRVDSNLRVLYETRFKMNARCRRESRRVRALRAS